MKYELLDKQGHLTLTAIQLIKENSLEKDYLDIALEHICNCEGCAEVFANSFLENELVQAPEGFQEEIMSKVINMKEKNNQFLFYSFRVAIAACISLIIVFSSTFNYVENTQIGLSRINPPDLSIINSVNTGLSDFSQKIVSMEVFYNDKEKR